jgi:AraC-like DNA-binding protein/mannose-6-phosphate isomerase-like protein (cupin superfamily)
MLDHAGNLSYNCRRMPKKRQPCPSADDDVRVRTLAARQSAGYHIPTHHHTGWDQLVYATEGVMTIDTAHGSWVVPCQRAVWVPSDTPHSVTMNGSTFIQTIYLRASMAKSLPRSCCVVNVSPLLRELIVHIMSLGLLREKPAAHARLIGVLLDQLCISTSEPLQLRMPTDARARRVAEALRERDGPDLELSDVARQAGASKRTLERLFLSQTGLTLGRWRQQARLLRALPLLAAGESVTSVALEVGYENTGAFITMFKRSLGTTPARYYRGP